MSYIFSTSSGQKSATAQITTQRGALMGIDMIPPNIGTATLIVYDTATADNTAPILAEVIVDAGVASCNHEFYAPCEVSKGIYCVLTQTGGGTGSTYIVRFYLG